MQDDASVSSSRAVETLLEVDPDFGLLCDVLYGPDVDAQTVWDDVFGISKSAGGDSESKTLKRIGLAATLIGAGLGVKELHTGVKELRHVNRTVKAGGTVASSVKNKHALKLLPKNPNTQARAIGATRVGASTLMLGGDLAATESLRRSKSSVAKVGLPQLTAGVKRSWHAAEQAALKLVPRAVKPTVSAGKEGPIAATSAKELLEHEKQAAQGAKVGGAVRHPLRTAAANPGKTTLGVAGVAATHHALKKPKQVSYEDAYYGKGEPEFVAEGTFTKFDTDKRLAFGWASVVKKDGLDVVDRQGDYMTIDDVEDAAYKYVMTSRVGGDMHKRNGDRPHHISDMVESFVVTPEKIAKMGLPEGTPQGWWVGFKINDDNAWNEVKVGKKLGFSIHGKGKRADHVLDGY